MTDTTQSVIVTVVALMALGVLVWPLVPGRKPKAPPAKPGCASCAADHGETHTH